MLILCLLLTACAATIPLDTALAPYLQSDHHLALNVRLVFLDVPKTQENIDLAVGNIKIAEQYFQKINLTFHVTQVDQYSSCDNVYDLSSIVLDSNCYQDCLNIYICPPTNYLLGWSTFPEQGPLPAIIIFGPSFEYDPSLYAHEIGHYLGLHHTFSPENKEGLFVSREQKRDELNVMGYGFTVSHFDKYFTDLQLIHMRETLLKYRYQQLLNYGKQFTTYSGIS